MRVVRGEGAVGIGLDLDEVVAAAATALRPRMRAAKGCAMRMAAMHEQYLEPQCVVNTNMSLESPHVSQIMAPGAHPLVARPLLEPAQPTSSAAKDGMLRTNAHGQVPREVSGEQFRFMQAKQRAAAPPDWAYLRSVAWPSEASSGRFLGSGKARVDPLRNPTPTNLPHSNDTKDALFYIEPVREHKGWQSIDISGRPADSLAEGMQGAAQHWADGKPNLPPPPCALALTVPRPPDPLARTAPLKEDKLFTHKRAGALKPPSTFQFG